MHQPLRATDTLPDVPLFNLDTHLAAEMRNLMVLVGELTIAMVVQGAQLSASRNRRDRPDEFDVDEAIAQVAARVPDSVADGLWDARDSLVDRLRNGPSLTATARS